MSEEIKVYTTDRSPRDAAISTILEIWSCIEWEKVDGKRAMGIWDEVASKVKAAAMTTTKYERFVEKLCRKLDVRSLRYREISDIEKQPEEFKQKVLKLLREETLSIMLEVRLNNQVRKEMAQAEKERQEKIKKLNEKADNLQVNFEDWRVKVNET